VTPDSNASQRERSRTTPAQPEAAGSRAAMPGAGYPETPLSDFEPLGIPAGVIEPDGATAEPDRSMNMLLPSMIGGMAFRDPQLTAAYVQRTAPWLDMVDFHTCLGGLERMSKGMKWAVALTALLGSLWLMKQEQKAQQPPEDDGQETAADSD